MILITGMIATVTIQLVTAIIKEFRGVEPHHLTRSLLMMGMFTSASLIWDVLLMLVLGMSSILGFTELMMTIKYGR